MALPVEAERTATEQPETLPAIAPVDDAQHTYLLILLLLAAAMEGVLIVFVRRLSLRKIPDVVPTPQPVASALGISERGLTWFVVAIGALVICQFIAFAIALR